MWSKIMAPFAGLEVPDQPAASPHILLFTKPAKQYFSLSQPVSFNQISDQRTGLAWIPKPEVMCSKIEKYNISK